MRAAFLENFAETTYREHRVCNSMDRFCVQAPGTQASTLIDKLIDTKLRHSQIFLSVPHNKSDGNARKKLKSDKAL